MNLSSTHVPPRTPAVLFKVCTEAGNNRDTEDMLLFALEAMNKFKAGRSDAVSVCFDRHLHTTMLIEGIYATVAARVAAAAGPGSVHS